MLLPVNRYIVTASPEVTNLSLLAAAGGDHLMLSVTYIYLPYC